MDVNPYKPPEVANDTDAALFEGEITAKDVGKYRGGLWGGFALLSLGIVWAIPMVESIRRDWSLLVMTPLPLSALWLGGWLLRSHFCRVSESSAFTGYVRGRIGEDLLELETEDAKLRLVRRPEMVTVQDKRINLSVLKTTFPIPLHLFDDPRSTLARLKSFASKPANSQLTSEDRILAGDGIRFSGFLQPCDLSAIVDTKRSVWQVSLKGLLVWLGLMGILAVVKGFLDGRFLACLFGLGMVYAAFRMLKPSKPEPREMHGYVSEGGFCSTTTDGECRLSWSGFSKARLSSEAALLTPRAFPGSVFAFHKSQFESTEDWECVREIVLAHVTVESV